jgi:hypothetical protein
MVWSSRTVVPFSIGSVNSVFSVDRFSVDRCFLWIVGHAFCMDGWRLAKEPYRHPKKFLTERYTRGVSMIDKLLTAFLEGGVGVHIGTRNAQLEPNGARAISVKVERDRQHLLVFISEVAARRVLPDLEANGEAALTFARPTDERACQVKGAFVDVRKVHSHELAHARQQWSDFLDNLEYIGIPRLASRTWVDVADLAIRLRVTDVFDQTPGPNAGRIIG